MPENHHRDPRDVLVQDKFYTHLPDPIFDAIAEHKLPATAILVLLTHMKAGMISGDHCSEIPIDAVAARCRIRPSTVTRAYQLLIRLGLLERTDPGRDTARPMQQAVAITEFRLPPALLRELSRYPNRRRPNAISTSPEPEPPPSSAPTPAAAMALTDPFAGLSGRERMAAQARLLERLSPAERARYDHAFTHREPVIPFDTDCRLSEHEQRTLLQLLAILARAQPAEPPKAPCTPAPTSGQRPRPRRLSSLEIGHLRRGLQAARGEMDVDELLRQVVWSVQHGALEKFPVLKATRIALKKVREGLWTRPHRMPPNWMLRLTNPPPAGARAAWADDARSQIPSREKPSFSPPRSSRGCAPMSERLTAWRAGMSRA